MKPLIGYRAGDMAKRPAAPSVATVVTLTAADVDRLRELAIRRTLQVLLREAAMRGAAVFYGR